MLGILANQTRCTASDSERNMLKLPTTPMRSARAMHSDTRSHRPQTIRSVHCTSLLTCHLQLVNYRLTQRCRRVQASALPQVGWQRGLPYAYLYCFSRKMQEHARDYMHMHIVKPLRFCREPTKAPPSYLASTINVFPTECSSQHQELPRTNLELTAPTWLPGSTPLTPNLGSQEGPSPTSLSINSESQENAHAQSTRRNSDEIRRK
ncbi:hypothetical protein BDN72DRAFT_460239 [Pluteus cervinus]|uniref:Uncharacterized protein n=1 Tax=Pluteus cervinus TaxID=181527 RepID=A0ACD3A6W9_9AGAR|nr:hypothetical protein BDN72DRAFT_460239 [Pluteus cervinus]